MPGTTTQGDEGARASYVDVPRERVPRMLAELHHAVALGSSVLVTVAHQGSDDAGPADLGSADPPSAFRRGPETSDPELGSHRTGWGIDALTRVVVGAGFSVDAIHRDAEDHRLEVVVRRLRTLPDVVGPRMRLLLCGLNPSLYAADAGVGFARPGNRFWPAALAAGIVSRDRDALHALDHHGVGMTDLVKRATARAQEVARDEYLAGADRVQHLVQWLRPGVVCFVGLSGYRTAVDRRATAGVQPEAFGGVPAYVMPNPSGINARATPAILAEHLRAAARLADDARRGDI